MAEEAAGAWEEELLREVRKIGKELKGIRRLMELEQERKEREREEERKEGRKQEAEKEVRGEEREEGAARGEEGKLASTQAEAEGSTPSAGGSGDKEETKEVAKAEGGKGREEEEAEWRREMEARERRRRNVTVRGLGGEGRKETGAEWVKRNFGRWFVVVKEWEIRGEGKEVIWVVEMEDEADKRRILENKDRMWREERVKVEKDMTYRERAKKWRVTERVREARRKGLGAEVENWETGEIRIEGEKWVWDEREEEWGRKEGA